MKVWLVPEREPRTMLFRNAQKGMDMCTSRRWRRGGPDEHGALPGAGARPDLLAHFYTEYSFGPV